MAAAKVVMVLERLLDGGQSMEVIRQITLAMTLFSLMILSHWFSSHYDVYASWQVSGAYLMGCLPALLMWCWLGLGYGCLLILFLYCYHHHHHDPTSSYVASDSLFIAILGEFWSPFMKVVDVSNAWCSFSNGTRKKSGSVSSKCSCKEIGN